MTPGRTQRPTKVSLTVNGHTIRAEVAPRTHLADFLREDLLLTGTPGGVGNARKPPVYLQPGQTLRTVIESLGECVNRCVPDTATASVSG